MKKEVSPVFFGLALAVVLVVVVVVGYKMIGSRGFNKDTKGSEGTMKKVQETGKFYVPPADAPVPGAGGVRPNGSNFGTAPPSGMQGMMGGPPQGAPGAPR